MKCIRCGATMVEKQPSIIYPTNPLQYDRMMWCACGHTENLGRVYAVTEETGLMARWKSANGRISDEH